MKFYGRESELTELRKTRSLSERRGYMTVITGRRRIGKTRLVKESLSGEKYIYLFINRQNERLLCERLTKEIRETIDTPIYSPFTEFRTLFNFLLDMATTQHITVVVDEFQEFTRINAAVYGDIQDLWDKYRDKIKMHLILTGSVQSLMVRIFDHYQEPLYGRADRKLRLGPLSISILRVILREYAENPTPRDLLTLYATTGGTPRYVELLMDDGAVTQNDMIRALLNPQFIFLTEGKFLLLQEFGKDHGTYFSVLSMIAGSRTSRGQIESTLQRPVGGYLTKLLQDYHIIERIRPIFSKQQSSTVRYHLRDNFLRFWFQFIYRNDNLVQLEQYELLRRAVEKSWAEFLGQSYERMVRQALSESGDYTHVGNYWEKGHQNEIDVIAYNEFTKRAVIGEVKLNGEKISLTKLEGKATKALKNLTGYTIECKGFGLSDLSL